MSNAEVDCSNNISTNCLFLGFICLWALMWWDYVMTSVWRGFCEWKSGYFGLTAAQTGKLKSPNLETALRRSMNGWMLPVNFMKILCPKGNLVLKGEQSSGDHEYLLQDRWQCAWYLIILKGFCVRKVDILVWGWCKRKKGSVQNEKGSSSE